MKGFKGCDATNHLQIWLKLNFWAVKYNYLINYQSCWGKSALYIDLILSLLNSQTLNTSCKNSKLKKPFRKCHWTWSLNLYALCNMLPNVDAIIFLKQFFLQFKLQLEELKKKALWCLADASHNLRSNSRSQTTDCSRMVQSTNVPPDSALWNCKISGRLLLINNMVDHWRIFLTNSPAPAGSANKIWSQVYPNSAWDT